MPSALPTCLVVCFSAFLVMSAPAGSDAREPFPAAARNAPAAYVTDRFHDAGLLSLKVTNLGVFGSPFNEALNAGWKGEEYLYSSGLWVGAVTAGPNLRVSTATLLEFRPDLDPRWTLYESYEGQKSGVRLGAGGADAADDDADLFVDEDFQNGLDDDGDGRIDEDFAAIGQQMYSAMYRDDTPEALGIAGHVPLGLLVRQRSFQWSVEGINEFVGVEFEIRNDGEQNLSEVYVGILTDSDVGPPDAQSFQNDDLVGWGVIDTTVNTGLAVPCDTDVYHIPAVYMWDAPGGGDVPGVFGNVLLGHTTDLSGLVAPQEVSLPTVDWWTSLAAPTTDAARYAGMSSGTRPAKNATLPSDYRHLMAVGPFSSLHPGESIRFEIAYVIGDGLDGFRTNAVSAQRVYKGRYLDADQNPATGIEGRETCLQILEPGGQILWDDPCDTSQTFVVFDHTDPCDVAGPHHVDADCDPCTGSNGQETLLNWVGMVAPPFPATNLDPSLDPLIHPGLVHLVPPAGKGQVMLQWDNAPKLWEEPQSGQIIFEGYHIWKVSNWPDGPVGPGPGDWEQLAEYRENPPGGMGDPQHIQNITNLGVEAVGQDEDGRPIYPIGRYELADVEVVNGQTYFYSVTAFGFLEVVNLVTLLPESLAVERLPTAPLAFAVVPCDTCDLVPVRLLAFSVERLGEGAHLAWTVGEAWDHAGFHVYREQSGRARVRLTEALLTGGPEHEFLDPEAPPGAVDYWLEEVGRDGSRAWHGPARLAAAAGIPPRLGVGMASPNPFRSRMSLSYSLPEARAVRASIYDLSGRRVRTLIDALQGPGVYTLSWQGETDRAERVAPGLYLLRFEAGGEVVSRKVLFVP